MGPTTTSTSPRRPDPQRSPDDGTPTTVASGPHEGSFSDPSVLVGVVRGATGA